MIQRPRDSKPRLLVESSRYFKVLGCGGFVRRRPKRAYGIAPPGCTCVLIGQLPQPAALLTVSFPGRLRRGAAQPGSALASGARSRRFKSGRPDQQSLCERTRLRAVFRWATSAQKTSRGASGGARHGFALDGRARRFHPVPRGHPFSGSRGIGKLPGGSVGFRRSSLGFGPILDRICGHRHGLSGNRAPACTLSRTPNSCN